MIVNVHGGMQEQALILTELVHAGVKVRSYAPVGSGIEQRLIDINQETA